MGTYLAGVAATIAGLAIIGFRQRIARRLNDPDSPRNRALDRFGWGWPRAGTTAGLRAETMGCVFAGLLLLAIGASALLGDPS